MIVSEKRDNEPRERRLASLRRDHDRRWIRRRSRAQR